MSDEHRHKIANSNILNALIGHAQGDREMSATQVSAGLGLLRKVLPDLSAIELDGSLGLKVERVERVIVDPQKPSEPADGPKQAG